MEGHVFNGRDDVLGSRKAMIRVGRYARKRTEAGVESGPTSSAAALMAQGHEQGAYPQGWLSNIGADPMGEKLRHSLVPAIGGNSEKGDRDGNTGNAREGDGEA